MNTEGIGKPILWIFVVILTYTITTWGLVNFAPDTFRNKPIVVESQAINSYDFEKSIKLCKDLGLTWNSIKSNAICINQKEDNCLEYATQSIAVCSDKVKGLDDLKITFITKYMD